MIQILTLARRFPQVGDIVGRVGLPEINRRVIAIHADRIIDIEWIGFDGPSRERLGVKRCQYRRLEYISRADRGPIAFRVPSPDGTQLSDLRFGRIVARVLARGPESTKRRHPSPPRRWPTPPRETWIIPSPGFRDMGAFFDEIRLTVESTDAQRAVLDRIADRRGLPRFFDR